MNTPTRGFTSSILRFSMPLVTAVVLVLAAPARGSSIVAGGTQFIALDLADPQAPDAEPAFTDPLKAARWSRSPASANAQTVLVAKGNYPAGDYVLSYRGTGRVSAGGAVVIDRRPGRLVLRIMPGSGDVFIRLETTAAGDPLRDLRLTPLVSRASANQPYLPAFVAGLSGASALRFGSWHLGYGLALQDEIALANQAGIAPWFVIPHAATDADVVAAARTVRAELDPRLRPIFEWDATPGRPDPESVARSARVADLVASAFQGDARRPVRLIDAADGAAALSAAGKRGIARYDGLAIAAGDPRAPALATLARSNGVALFAYRGVGAVPAPAAKAPAAAKALNTWPTYGFDAAHDGYNANTAAFTPAALASLHLAWTAETPDLNTQTQPILIANGAGNDGTLLVGGASGTEYAFDALTGAQIWSKPTGRQTLNCGTGDFEVGTSGTAVYAPSQKAAFIADTQNGTSNGPSTVIVHKFNPQTGVDIANLSILPPALPGELDTAHTSLTLDGKLNLLYVGVSSTCDISSWRGSVTVLNTVTMKVIRTFYTAYGRGAKYSGGGVWGWGGVTLDAAGNVYFGAGNADNSGTNQPPFAKSTSEHVGYAEHLVKTTPRLDTVIASNYPGFTGQNAGVDLDFMGSPTIFTPVGCPELLGLQGKSGQLVFYNAAAVGNGPIATFPLSEASYEGVYLGNPGWSPNTQLVYAAVASALGGSLKPPGMVAVDVSTCTPAIVWSAAFGPDSFSLDDTPPRTAPTVTAGGVVFLGAPQGAAGGALWALDASSGAILNGGQPVLTTPERIRMAPVISGNWLWLFDNDGDLYGMTLGADVRAVRNGTLVGHRPKRSAYRRFRL